MNIKEKKLTDDLLEIISQFGDGMTEFHTRDIEKLINIFSSKDTELQTANWSIKALNETISGLNKFCHDQSKEIEELKKELNESSRFNLSLEGQLLEKDLEITGLQSELDRLKGEVKLWKIKFFIGKKIKVGTEQNSRKIQEMLLDLDFEWTYTDGKSEKTVQFTDAKYLFFEGSEVLPQLRKTISCSSNDQVFKSQYQKEIFLRDFRLT